MNKKNISCIIATHNRDEFLIEAVNSIINQSKSPSEIIISNNYPNKKTQLLVEKIIEESDIEIKYIEHRMKGRGPASANLAASKAKGDYLAFLDDDDLWEIKYLENILDLISEKKSKIIYTWSNKIIKNQRYPHKQLKENLSMKDFLLTNPGCGISNLVVDKKLFVSLGGFDDYINPSYDKDFIIRAMYYGYQYNVLKNNLVTQRKDNHEQLSNINKDFLLGMKKFFKKHEWIASPFIRIKFWIKYWKMYIKISVN